MEQTPKHPVGLVETIGAMWRGPRAVDGRRWLESVAAVLGGHPLVRGVRVLRLAPSRGRSWVLADGRTTGRLRTVQIESDQLSELLDAKTTPRELENRTAWLGAGRWRVACVSPRSPLPTYLALAFDENASPPEACEFEAVAAAVGLLREALLSALHRANAENHAVVDPLTRLPNRTAGLRTLENAAAQARRTGQPLSVLIIDLDSFKQLNDQFGHLTGDRALRLTAQVLRGAVRAADTLFRYGGEEFVAVLPNTEPDEASVLAARLFMEIERVGLGHQLPLTVSIGLAMLREDDSHIEAVISRADVALYASKTRGRNRFSADIY